MRRLRRLLGRLSGNSSGVAMTEFALSLPFMMTAGLWGVELANYALINMRVSQIAMQLADNASRIGDTSNLDNRKIYEADINDLLLGASLQGGNRLEFFEHGRAIISSLEVHPDHDDDRQYIAWQRCMGKKNYDSSYGVEGDGADGSLDGMGPEDEEVIAFEGEAVMFVEVAYDYQALISPTFVGEPEIKSISSFTVRSDRDLSQIYQRPSASDPVARCDVYVNTV